MHSNSSKKDVRRKVNMVTRLVQPDGSALANCLLIDVSATGARLKLDNSNPLPEQFLLLLSRSGQLCRHCALESQDGRSVNVRFVPPSRKRAVRGSEHTSAEPANLEEMAKA